MNPLVTFEESEMNHLREGMKASVIETLDWLESAGEFSAWSRQLLFAKGRPVTDHAGNLYWNEEDYLGVPEWARGDRNSGEDREGDAAEG